MGNCTFRHHPRPRPLQSAALFPFEALAGEVNSSVVSKNNDSVLLLAPTNQLLAIRLSLDPLPLPFAPMLLPSDGGRPLHPG